MVNMNGYGFWECNDEILTRCGRSSSYPMYVHCECNYVQIQIDQVKDL